MQIVSSERSYRVMSIYTIRYAGALIYASSCWHAVEPLHVLPDQRSRLSLSSSSMFRGSGRRFSAGGTAVLTEGRSLTTNGTRPRPAPAAPGRPPQEGG